MIKNLASTSLQQRKSIKRLLIIVRIFIYINRVLFKKTIYKWFLVFFVIKRKTGLPSIETFIQARLFVLIRIYFPRLIV